MKFIEQKRAHIPAKTEFIKHKFLDIQYAPGNERRTLDIYLPNDGEGPYPVIIDIYGGGWYFGQKSSYKMEPALELLRRGFAVVSINYSLSYQAKFPTQVQEVKASIRYVRKHAAEFQLDPSRIALMGESAGAHYATLAACSTACGKLIDGSWPNQDVSDEVQAVIAVYCPVNIGLTREYFAVQQELNGLEPLVREFGESDSPEGVLLGGVPKEVPEMVELANPANYLNEKCPPFLFLHGDQDQVVPIICTMAFAAKMMYATSIDNVKFQLVKDARHDILDFEKEWIYDLEVQFLRDKMHIEGQGEQP